MLTVIGIVLWLAMGWLPTRLTKHYFNMKFASSGGFGIDGEAISIFMALGGPAGAAASLTAWILLTSGEPKGWQW